MTYVNSVTGKIDLSNLGTTLVHEHLLLRSEIVTFQFPHLYDETHIYNKAVTAAKEVKSQGVQTICDPTVAGMGRDVNFLKRVSEESEVQVITATGIYSFTEIPDYFRNREIDHMAEVFARDIEVGIQNTDIKAAFLKCAADEPGVTQDLEKLFRGIARAHKLTGAPIMTHSHPATQNGLRQIEIFQEEGVDLSSVMVGHTGDSQDLAYIKKLISSGVSIGIDRYGQNPLTTPQRNEVLIQLLNEGYAENIFISQDYCCHIDWYTQEDIDQIIPGWSVRHLFDVAIPQLKEAGVTQQQLDIMMIDNVVKWFTKKQATTQILEQQHSTMNP